MSIEVRDIIIIIYTYVIRSEKVTLMAQGCIMEVRDIILYTYVIGSEKMTIMAHGCIIE